MMMADKINTELLERVKQHILEEPKRFDMHSFVTRVSTHAPEEIRPACGTTACIAGWAILLDRADRGEAVPRRISSAFYYSVEFRAMELLSLTEKQRRSLFYVSSWPQEFRRTFNLARTLSERAEIAARRIDRFIATNGAK